MDILDGLLVTVTTLIGLLLLTGGAYHNTPTFKLELSQVDAFGWVLLVILVTRRLWQGKWLSALIEKKVKCALQFLSANSGRVLLVSFTSYVFLMTWAISWRFDSFHASAFDFGYVEQALWSVTHDSFLHSSLSKGQSYLGEHFSPALALVGLLYRLAGCSPYFLFLFQSLVVGSGLWFVHRLALAKKLSPALATLVAILYFFYQPVRAANTFDFREDNLFIPVFFGALLAAERGRMTRFWVCAVASWSIKENAPLFTAMIGAWLFLRKENPRKAHGAILAIISLVVFIAVNSIITPHFAGPTQTMAVRRLRNLGNSNAEILHFLIEHPLPFVHEMLRPLLQLKALRYFLNVSAPFIVFACAAPLVSAIAAAGILMNLVLNPPTIGFHYECVLMPFLFFILIAGLATKARPALLPETTTAALLTVAFLLFFGRSPVDTIRRYIPSDRDRTIAAILHALPSEASVATQGVLFPHLTHRHDAYIFNRTSSVTDYIAVDLSPARDRYATPDLDADIARIDSAQYDKVVDQDDFKLWKHR